MIKVNLSELPKNNSKENVNIKNFKRKNSQSLNYENMLAIMQKNSSSEHFIDNLRDLKINETNDKHNIYDNNINFKNDKVTNNLGEIKLKAETIMDLKSNDIYILNNGLKTNLNKNETLKYKTNILKSRLYN